MSEKESKDQRKLFCLKEREKKENKRQTETQGPVRWYLIPWSPRRRNERMGQKKKKKAEDI